MSFQFDWRVVVAAWVICWMASRPAVAQDGFADNLTIPEGIEISDPVQFSAVATPQAQDEFRARLLKVITSEDSGESSVVADLPNLAASFKDKRELMERYLASSPAWRVFEVRGARYATRRWKMAGGCWHAWPGNCDPCHGFTRRSHCRKRPYWRSRLH